MKNFIFTLLFLCIYGISAAQSSIASEINLGEKALAKGDYKEAAAHFQKVLYSDSLERSKQLFYEGIIAYSNKKYILTIKQLSQMMKLDSTNVEAYYVRGLSNYAFGEKYAYFQKVQAAVKDMEKVEQLSAKYKDVAKVKPKIEALYQKLLAEDALLVEDKTEIAQNPSQDVNVEEQPKPLTLNEVKMAMGYPEVAQEAGIQGQVMVRILVNKNGTYVRHIIVKSAHPILQEAVEEVVDFIVCSPGIVDGKPIKFWLNIPFNFKLQ